MENALNNIDEAEIRVLIDTLCGKDGMERQKARESLAAKGKSIIYYLKDMLNHPKYIYRWEAIKTIEEIAEPSAIPLLINALEDEKNDVRWIAAEGLIKLGQLSIKPLLKALIEKSDSVFLLAGAHHVFYELREKEILKDNFPIENLLSALSNTTGTESIVQLAYDILNKF